MAPLPTAPSTVERPLRWRSVLTLLVMLGLLVLSPSLTGLAAAMEPTVIVQGFQVNPPVLVPGEIGTIVVNLTNTADAASRTTTQTSGTTQNTVTSSETLPINVLIKEIRLSGGEVVVLSGAYSNPIVLGPGQSIPVTFLIRAPGQTGIYFTRVSITVVGGQGASMTIPVNVNTQISVPKEPAIIVEKSVPDRVVPGERFAVNLRLVNRGLSAADEVNLFLQSNSTNLLALTPSTFHINRLGPEQSESIQLEFATDRNTPLGLTPVVLHLEYLGPSGTRKQQTEVVGILIQGRAEMNVALVSTSPVRITAGDAVDLTIRIENIGTADADSVEATLSNLSLPGTRKAFMGRIEPRNDAPAVFSLEADRAGEVEYLLTIQYSDEFGDHEARETLRMTIRDRDFTGLFLAIGVLVVALVAISLWFWRRRGT